jgi:hypothetical protein
MPARQIRPRIAVSAVFVVAMFMAIMDTTIVNVALPTISRLPGPPGRRHPACAVQPPRRKAEDSGVSHDSEATLAPPKA